MLPIHFDGANVILKKVDADTDENIMPLHAHKGITEKGQPYYLTMWQPSKEDLEALNAGRAIWMSTLGEYFPPVMLFTCDENNVSNDM